MDPAMFGTTRRWPLRPFVAVATLAAACRDQPAPTIPPLPGAASAPRPAASEDPARAVLASAAEPTRDASAFVPERVQGTGAAMGTHIAFAAYTTPAIDAAQAREAFSAAVEEIKRVESLMTTWRDSEVSRINAAAGKTAVKVGEETFTVIKEAVRTSEISDGTFDITFHTLHGLWKFDEDLDPHPPSDAAVKARLPFVGWRNIKLDETERTVMLAKDKTQIGLGGIAKGYAVDMAARVLERAGLRSYFVQAGGDLLARGRKPDGTEWQAGIRDPRSAEGKHFALLSLTDHAFSTAGDYERAYIVGGKRYHHIIDPRTGQPATACRSVTIWAPTALLADEIDDAVFILGPEKGMKLVESIDGVGAVIVDARNNVGVSKRLQGKLQVIAVPTDGIWSRRHGRPRLGEELPDGGLEPGLSAGIEPDEHLAHDAALVDEHHRRKPHDPVCTVGVSRLVDDGRITHLEPLGRDGRELGLVGRDPDDGEPLRAEPVLQRVQPRRDHPARSAPGRPEVDDRDLSLQRRDRRRSAREHGDVAEGRRGRADEVHLDEIVARRARGKHDRRADRAAGALHPHRHGVAHLVHRDRAGDVARRGHARAVDRDDPIPGAEPSALGRRPAHHVLDPHADVTAVVHRDPEPREPRRRRRRGGGRRQRRERPVLR
jgi:thiamine biosynthesis lipoprotein